MKKINYKLLWTILIMIFSPLVFSQAPEGINYQAKFRNSSGTPIANDTVSIKVSIIDTTLSNTTVFDEEHRVETDNYGLFNIIIGNGTNQSGSISTIDCKRVFFILKLKWTDRRNKLYNYRRKSTN